ncbi:MAG: DUF6398 domain-containing protein [Bacteroidota bacterium]
MGEGKMKEKKFVEKKEKVEEIIFKLDLSMNNEDKKNIQKLIDSYFRKKKLFVNSKVEFIAGGILWVYSRINFLFQNDNEWSQKEIARKLDIKSMSISRTSSTMMDHLNIDVFDKRFVRNEIVEKDPRNNFFMTKEGFIVDKKFIEKKLLENMREKFGNFVDIRSDDEIECINLNEKKTEGNVKEIKDTTNKNLKDFFKDDNR